MTLTTLVALALLVVAAAGATLVLLRHREPAAGWLGLLAAAVGGQHLIALRPALAEGSGGWPLEPATLDAAGALAVATGVLAATTVAALHVALARRSRRESDLRDERDALRATLERLPAIVVAPNHASSVADLLGVDDTDLPAAELLARHVHPDDQDALGRARRAAAEERTALTQEYRLVTGDGAVRYVLERASAPASADDTAPVEEPRLLVDVTELRHREMRTAAERDELAVQLAELHDRHGELERRHGALARRCDDLDAQREHLAQRGDELERLRRELAERCSTLEDRGAALETERDELQVARDGLRARCATLEVSQRQLDAVLRAPWPIAFRDEDGRCTRSNEAFARLGDAASAIGGLAGPAPDGGEPRAVSGQDGAERRFVVATAPLDGGSVLLAADVTPLHAQLAVQQGRATRAELRWRELDERHAHGLAMLQELVEPAADAGHPLAAHLAEHHAWMQRVHALTRGRHDAPRPLTELVRAVTPPSPQIILRGEGDDCEIPAAQVAPFCAVVYQLVSASLAGGALSAEHGRVRIAWETRGSEGDQRRVRFSWSEDPPAMIEVKPLEGGTARLVEELLSSSFGGEIEVAGNDLGIEHRMHLVLDDSACPLPTASSAA